ncbi:hypothetical protein FHL81_01120 [Agrobacterium tumefaciens]|nr:hypothetical protein FHL81_01120 [Agrobacterium tumefaciens]KAB0457873.1 hypothetical protein F7R04_21985 [Agrobacterium tumefaciens]QAA98491.1 hypothetical protein DC439_13010 [Agrobacterium tumefaciens]TGE77958.1 hypothetical protein C9410_19285 [Rhizobium sp. SEMIA 439]
MRLMLQRRIAALTMMVAGVIFTVMPPAAADDYYGRRDYHHQHRQSQVSFSTDGLPSTLSGGTYVGAISALRVRGNGNYFAIGGGLSRKGATLTRGSQLAPKAKIINVRAETADDACAYEHGVCIIRP